MRWEELYKLLNKPYQKDNMNEVSLFDKRSNLNKDYKRRKDYKTHIPKSQRKKEK